MRIRLLLIIILSALNLSVPLSFAQVEPFGRVNKTGVLGGGRTVLSRPIIVRPGGTFLGFRIPQIKTGFTAEEEKRCRHALGIMIKEADKFLLTAVPGGAAKSAAQAFRSFLANKLKTNCKTADDLKSLNEDLIGAMAAAIWNDYEAGKITLEKDADRLSTVNTWVGIKSIFGSSDTGPGVVAGFIEGDAGKELKNLVQSLSQLVTMTDSVGGVVDPGKALKDFAEAGFALKNQLKKI